MTFAAAKARLASSWPTHLGTPRIYEPNAVPKNAASPYVVLMVDTGRPENRRLGGGTQTLVRNVGVQIFSRLMSTWDDVADAADAAFRDQWLSDFPDPAFCTRAVAASPSRDADDAGWLSGTQVYTY